MALNWFRRVIARLNRRWIPDTVERERHAVVVRKRLARPAADLDAPDEQPADEGPKND